MYDHATGTSIRDLSAHHDARVGATDWNPATRTLACGGRDGALREYDLRAPGGAVLERSFHDAEVCGVRWAPDGATLATGDNGNHL